MASFATNNVDCGNFTAWCSVEDVANFLTQEGFSNPLVDIDSMDADGISATPIRVVTELPHGFVSNQYVIFRLVGGTVELNTGERPVTVIDDVTFDLTDTLQSDFSVYTSGGSTRLTDASCFGTNPSYDWVAEMICKTASMIGMALAVSGQGDCPLSPFHEMYCQLLNVVGTALFLEYENVRYFTPETKRRHQEWLDNQLELIRNGDIVLCAGETGKNYPAFATAETAYTEFAARDIIINRWLRTRTSNND